MMYLLAYYSVEYLEYTIQHKVLGVQAFNTSQPCRACVLWYCMLGISGAMLTSRFYHRDLMSDWHHLLAVSTLKSLNLAPCKLSDYTPLGFRAPFLLESVTEKTSEDLGQLSHHSSASWTMRL